MPAIVRAKLANVRISTKLTRGAPPRPSRPSRIIGPWSHASVPPCRIASQAPCLAISPNSTAVGRAGLNRSSAYRRRKSKRYAPQPAASSTTRTSAATESGPAPMAPASTEQAQSAAGAKRSTTIPRANSLRPRHTCEIAVRPTREAAASARSRNTAPAFDKAAAPGASAPSNPGVDTITMAASAEMKPSAGATASATERAR